MPRKLLIANRGEIACRVIKTARRMGIATVAVYSDADANALHVKHADEAYHIGAPAPKDSYLRTDRLLEVIAQSGTDAVHPGYGFLSENASFADALEKAGCAFVGPPASAIRAMGSKSEAKKIMGKAGVPLVPGYHGEDQDSDLLAAEADKIGYPVLIKASAGGGGKGMRAVEKPSDFKEALVSCKREAQSSFGDDHCLIEKLIVKPRHVEIQVFADAHSNAVYLFERDCSLQRRHQKVIEEAPAPGMSEHLRAQMGKAAVDAAKAIGYQGAGTVEFLLDASGSFYFMEMNTRLQVEHPVTEKITGEDLVEWQLRVADGEKLPKTQEELSINGHAFEVRIYAEDPQNDFLPATGKLVHMRMPRESDHVRVDTGVYQGGEVSIHYDPMIAKLITWDVDRTSALRRMASALNDVQIVGVTTNTGFLGNIARHPAFEAGEVETGFIPMYHDDLIPAPSTPDNDALAFAALDILLTRDAEAAAYAAQSSDPYSPWNSTAGFRLNDDNHHDLILRHDGDDIMIKVHYRDHGYVIDMPDGSAIIACAEHDETGAIVANLNNVRKRASVLRDGNRLMIFRDGRSDRLDIFDPLAAAGQNEGAGGGLTAPMPGKIIAVMAEAGQTVTAGDKLVVMEAMKMEHTISAPVSGTVREVFFGVGDQVDDGAELIAIEEAD
ncbi:acetyl/propionyl/methylcrotonyl-CoA carboxylase subunit alpha [Thalassospira australica]|uniref:acetyl/propionyl/methylcrotonyl-CoA carboxylase subunit alpha n=1 Tax=Thalassospira australica TaxID=1528106 RepID=UPI00051A1CB7|nr:acetyl/propionyl/methylcrotonyl-CoA carboxylase subunit alpha [Thalassospira australica]